MAEYTIDLSDSDIEKLTLLARRRGVSATEVIRQALATQDFLDHEVDLSSGDEVLIKKGEKFRKVEFQR